MASLIPSSAITTPAPRCGFAYTGTGFIGRSGGNIIIRRLPILVQAQFRDVKQSSRRHHWKRIDVSVGAWFHPNVAHRHKSGHRPSGTSLRSFMAWLMPNGLYVTVGYLGNGATSPERRFPPGPVSGFPSTDQSFVGDLGFGPGLRSGRRRGTISHSSPDGINWTTTKFRLDCNRWKSISYERLFLAPGDGGRGAVFADE